VWWRTGSELFYRNGRRYYAVPVSRVGETVTWGRPAFMFEGDYVVSSLFPGCPSYDVSPDGKRFIAVVRAADAPQIRQVEVILGWPREGESRLTPARPR